MIKILALFLCIFSLLSFEANATTQAWISEDKATILLEGNSIERDAINLYDSLNAPILYHVVGGLEVATKEIDFKNADGSPLLNIFCSVSVDGTDLGQCFISIEANRIIGPAMTVFDKQNGSLYLSVTGENQSARLAGFFNGFSSSGEVFHSADSRFSVKVEMNERGIPSFIFQYR